MGVQQKSDDILNFIKKYINEKNISPSVREIREGVGIRSTSTIHRYLHRLEQENKIHMTAGHNRTIVISEEIVKDIPLLDAESTSLFASESITANIKFRPFRAYNYPLFAVRAQKDIPEANICKDDILIGERSEQFTSGDYLLFRDDENLISVTNQSVPENPFGTLVSLIRDFQRKDELS